MIATVHPTFVQLGEAALLVVVCISLGGLPLVGWIVRLVSGQNLAQQGTGNVSVAAAFQQVGVPVGVVAALAEAAKGIIAVLLARGLLPQAPYWELLALMGLVLGRYRYGGSAGSTNVLWGLLVHAPIVTLATAAIGGLGYGLARRPRFWQYAVLAIFCGGMAWQYGYQSARFASAVALCLLLAWVYRQLPNDVAGATRPRSLNQPLAPEQVGQKAATLAELKQAGYPVAAGWVMAKDSDLPSLVDRAKPSENAPLIVRSSAVGEDQLGASAAGQYETIANVTSHQQLQEAIQQCFASYDEPAAVRYRQDRGIDDSAMTALVQRQVSGQFSGVAFSRDPVRQQPGIVLVEGLPGGADQVVSGEATPEQYGVTVHAQDLQAQPQPGTLPETVELAVEGEGQLPQRIVQQVAYLARQVEQHFHGIPQDIEWTHDGNRLWLLQARPITTLLPIWTRKIASEVLPGVIHPLTWSINQPMTCGVWGDIFATMLGDRAEDLNFDETATLHYAHTYFNASLMGHIFERLGLPAKSLEFLTLGESFQPPSVTTTVQNLPSLGRLIQREWQLERHFQQDNQRHFEPALKHLGQKNLSAMEPSALQQHIEAVLTVLTKATYYNILAPLSTSIRQAMLPVAEDDLDYSQTPEVAALRSLQALALETRQTFEAPGHLSSLETAADRGTANLIEFLAHHPEGEPLVQKLNDIVQGYGYLSESATDIAVPTWREQPEPAQKLFAQFVQNPPNVAQPPRQQGWLTRQVQRRIQLKGQVAQVYNTALAELRCSFLALAHLWQQAEHLSQHQDIFLLTWDEVQQGIQGEAEWETLRHRIEQRRADLSAYRDLPEVPAIVYGNEAPDPAVLTADEPAGEGQLQGIGASAGQVEGRIKVVHDWHNLPQIDRQTILAVPYTDAGWAPLLAQAGGLISEVGGRLSHGAIVAREYGIPAVMNLARATQRLKDGQRVRLYGQSGRVELLEDEP